MSFYSTRIPYYQSSDNSSPPLLTPSPLPSGSFELCSAALDFSQGQLESNDSNSALFQNGYLHGPSNSRVVTLQNQVNQLQIELIQAKTAYSTLESAFRELARNVQLTNTDPTRVTTATPTCNQIPPVDKQDHPDVKFWSRADWEKWHSTPQGLKQKVKRGPAPYLEHEDGQPVTEELLDAIRKTIRSIWFEFATKGLLPTSWSKLIHSTRLLFHSLVEEKHPLFRLATDGWKLDLLCSTSYPSWRKNHLDANGNYVKHSKKVKEENSNGESDARDRKRAWSPEPDSLCTKKRVKGESANSNSSNATATSPPNATTSPPTAITNSPAATTSINSPIDAMTSSPALESEEAAAGSVKSAGPSSTVNDQVELSTNFITSLGSPLDEPLDPFIDPMLLDDHINTQSLALLSPDSGKENMPAATLVPAPSIRPPPILLINPITSSTGSSRHPLTKSAMVNAATTPTVPLPGTSDAVKGAEALSSTIANSASPSFKPVSESTPLASPNDGPDTSASSKKIVRMRPGPKKNGRNLCAFRWLKQVNTGGGSTKEFNTYYSQLDKEQIELYDTEAARLEREGLWTKNSDILDGAMY
ncbi:hypothetical protein DEU56DRAFT_759389 [Suillus clintonianus]|uniref:uncharacterized protein n=1 Tax=Suillus clintonianus TaxID=1904413 RepID=UPI001B8631BF|nr:uncharacterized protein DEU56DRAFT_759389 [Suillus clintonianus]KAG2125147.1 hypothetical protein DEU56DRAFT_759389 [Suillus clintonianus]